MSQITLQQAAQVTGIPYALLKKHAQRGKLRTVKSEGNRAIMVEESDLEAYLTVEKISRTADEIQGEPLPTVTREIGNAIANLPAKVLNAILDGLPMIGKPARAGSPQPYLNAVKDMPKRDQGPAPDPDDPHHGYPIGYRHRQSPRWERSSESTWKLLDATWSWNGIFWEGGGSREGRELEEGCSPANPDSSKRPLSPPVRAGTGKAER